MTITVTGVNEPPDITGDVADYEENGDWMMWRLSWRRTPRKRTRTTSSPGT